MLQTSPSGPSLGALSLESAPRGGNEQPGEYAEGFSQEFDKQVKNVDSGERPDKGVEHKAAATSEQKERAEKGEVTAETDPADDATADSKETIAASGSEGSGNSLPLEQMRRMAADVQLLTDKGQQEGAEMIASEEEVELEAEEPVILSEEVNSPAEALLAVTENPMEAAKAASTPVVAAAVKEALAAKSETEIKSASALGETAEVAADEATLLDDGAAKRRVLPELVLRQAGKEGPETALPRLRGDRGFETMLSSMPGRGASAAAPVDTLSPTMAPLAGQGASNPLATPAPVAMTLAMPMQQANWGRAMAERVVWMTNANIQEAEIQLNPRELGPIGIKVTVSNDQANVSFVAQHAATREALESALPRLREMLSENGLQLGQSDVSQHGFKGRDGEAGDGAAGHVDAMGDEHLEGDELLAAMQGQHGVGYVTPSGVDAFV